MTVDLTAEELEIIEWWYQSASGESHGADTDAAFVLLDKLSIEATAHDLYLPNADHVIEEYRATVKEQIAAIIAYRRRHPDMQSVKRIEEEQPCA